ncbi:von Willebrand factor A domain-containing protein 3A [Saguinus oedipus]|uniref:von Willebrand factor A domain-containing protein 3A n=1 Tax=Saguinus oedipus TaxID=9490 RepID=A0ABQ9UKR9_SAGOE|nr:von Willebrand factor A domain-containing protein 3A [Saguinus oedipus]
MGGPMPPFPIHPAASLSTTQQIALRTFTTDLIGREIGMKKGAVGDSGRGKRGAQGSVYKKYPQGRGWMAKYGLKKLKLEISRCMGPNCTHQKSGQRSASARHCSIFPSIEIHGVVRHIQWTPREMEVYIRCVEKVLRRYVQRLQWLLSGSRRLFGTVLENRVCILLDTSGSMGPYLQQVKTELVLLIWEQLRKRCDSFNLLSFAEGLQSWQDTLVETTDAACHEAMQWKAFSFRDLEGLYLLTDGKPDTSCSLVLNEVQRLREKRDVKVHTISLNCSDRAAVEFLRKLASFTSGRYHCPVGEDTLSKIHSLLTKGFIDEKVHPTAQTQDHSEQDEDVDALAGSTVPQEGKKV